MKKVLIYSVLLVIGLIASQMLPHLLGEGFGKADIVIKVLTMFCLGFIMIHVGYEFEIDKGNLRHYGWDYIVAATAAAFPWVFCALYFVYVLAPPEMWTSAKLWEDTLLEARFASPTSAGVLFSMLAAAGLGATWVFQKARVLAIFDDVDTVLFMIPLTMMITGLRWQLGVIIVVILAMLYLGWTHLHAWKIPVSWPWVMGYAAAIAVGSEAIYLWSKGIDHTMPIHIEVLLPAFALGCMMKRPAGQDPHSDDTLEGHEEGPEAPGEQRVSTIISAFFMLLVGLSMPAVIGAAPHGVDGGPAKTYAEMAAMYGVDEKVVASFKSFPGWGKIALHVLAITLLSNLGKMFPAFCYRKEASFRERVALSVGMFPRGEVGAGVLVISLSYGIDGTALTVAMLSLALNLVCTGLFILVVKRLIKKG